MSFRDDVEFMLTCLRCLYSHYINFFFMKNSPNCPDALVKKVKILVI